jgi:glycosyltransferase involved in cell wall biosynthesis
VGEQNRISLIIPTYNRATLISATLQSVFSQQDPCFEVILVDDGSTDDTQDVIRAWKDRLLYVRQDNAGVAAARNHGLRLAGCEWVTFLDSDDLWTPDKITQDLRTISQFPSAKAVYGGKRILSGERIGRPLLPPPAQDDFLEKLALRNTLSVGAVTIRREALISVGGFAEERVLGPSADWELWVRLAARYEFAFTGKATLLVREHPSNMMHAPQKMEQAIESALDHFLADPVAGERLAPKAGRIRSRAALFAGVGYYGCGDMQSARNRLRKARSLDTNAVLHPLWLFTYFRSLFGARACAQARKWKRAMTNRFRDIAEASR